MDKKNILIIIPALFSGGAERVATNLATNLNEYYNVIIAVFDASKNVYDAGDIEIIDLKTKSSKNILKKVWNYIIRIIKVRKLKKDRNIYCAISFMAVSNFINVLTKRKEKVIVSIRNKMSSLSQTKLEWYINKIGSSKADCVVSLSKMVKYDQEKFFNTNPEKSKVIYNACDVNKIKDMAKIEDYSNEEKKLLEENNIVITAGRLTKQKGQWHLIRAFKEVIKEIPTAKLIILGTGELEEYLKTLIKELKLDKNIFMLGFSENPYKYMIKADLFVFTSIFEGFGNILLEAMACDLPIISVDCEYGPRELLSPNSNLLKKIQAEEEGEYGILLPVCDGIHYNANDKLTNEEKLIANSIIKLLKDEKKRNMYKEKAKLRIKDFNKDNNTEQWIDLIENI